MTGPQAAKIIGSIFRARRDLVSMIKRQVLSGMGVTLEQADLLVDLYGARRLGWPEPKAIEGGWVTFSALKETLVHARELLTRRLQELEQAGKRLADGLLVTCIQVRSESEFLREGVGVAVFTEFS